VFFGLMYEETNNRIFNCNLSNPFYYHRLSYRPRFPRSSTMGSRGRATGGLARDLDITLDQTDSYKAHRGQAGREREDGVA